MSSGHWMVKGEVTPTPSHTCIQALPDCGYPPDGATTEKAREQTHHSTTGPGCHTAQELMEVVCS